MMRPFLVRISLLFAAGLAGCSARGDVDLLESRLRIQEDQIGRLETELAAARSEVRLARQETETLRNQMAGRQEDALLPEQANQLVRAQGVRFHPMLTGGLNRDDQPGDELLAALLAPHDANGELLKLPGHIRLELYDLAQAEADRRIGAWEFDPEESRRLWHNGVLGAGYLFRLPWKQSPENSELVLHAELTTTDGRQFNANQKIQIAPPEQSTTVATNKPPADVAMGLHGTNGPEWQQPPSGDEESESGQNPFDAPAAGVGPGDVSDPFQSPQDSS